VKRISDVWSGQAPKRGIENQQVAKKTACFIRFLLKKRKNREIISTV
jgi:hypothetical protein